MLIIERELYVSYRTCGIKIRNHTHTYTRLKAKAVNTHRLVKKYFHNCLVYAYVRLCIVALQMSARTIDHTYPYRKSLRFLKSLFTLIMNSSTSSNTLTESRMALRAA